MSENRHHLEVNLTRWQRMTAWPIIAISFAYISVYVLPIYCYPLSSNLAAACHVTEYSIWSLFIIDYVAQLLLARDKKNFLKHEWLFVESSSSVRQV